jgi:hypothetical protein
MFLRERDFLLSLKTNALWCFGFGFIKFDGHWVFIPIARRLSNSVQAVFVDSRGQIGIRNTQCGHHTFSVTNWGTIPCSAVFAISCLIFASLLKQKR